MARASTVSFVYSNPRHHAETMAPVMAELVARGAAVRAISLAELRGFAIGSLPGQGAPPESIHVTGNPRFDGFDPAAWRDRGAELLASLGIARPPVPSLYLERHLAHRGSAGRRVATLVADVAAIGEVTAAPVEGARRRSVS